ncbi:MAG TPA: hypothetical protein VJ783_31435 [Pirellulales bacterium]|nr:hypothetical protein [Pirellulales bacterium]
MNRGALVRKLVYGLLILALLLPLSYFSQPATVAVGNQPNQAGSPGGKLAQLRTQYGISEANLGEIDAAGETIKLATLGLRGVAANILWEKANTAKMKEDWEGMRAALDQLSKLEPHFVIVWRYQAWNVSYNISVEFDDYRQRYFWIKEGIKYLQQGTRYNELEPRLIYDVGWFTAHKMGVADEKKEFRELFRVDDDEEFPAHDRQLRRQDRRDNWLVGQEYFEQAIALVEDREASIHAMNPFVFFSQPAMCQIDYAVALEEDGVFEEKARLGWTDAYDRWIKYGMREVPTSDNLIVRLAEEEAVQERKAKVIAQLEAVEPGLRDKIAGEKRSKLPPEVRAALDTPPESRTEEEHQLVYGASMSILVLHDEVAKRVEKSHREQAQKLAAEANRLEVLENVIHRDRDVVNYNYWRNRCKMEKTESALEARRLIYQAKTDYDLARLVPAQQEYEEAFRHWRKTVDEFPQFIDDTIGAESIHQALAGYADVLKQLNTHIPRDFVLKDVLFSAVRRNPTGMDLDFIRESFEGDPGLRPPGMPPR